MLEYPSDGVDRLYKDGKPLSYTPYLNIGSTVKGFVHNIFPYRANIQIFNIDGYDAKTNYTAILNSKHIPECKEFQIGEVLKHGDHIEAVVISLGCKDGVVLSCIKEERNLKK
ncbi:hypothetical protein SLOPH_807 [Spraguea lophii 42_110]|uniref:S1 motif domain-containing protein n=1 Tax=Spraguea lophii (strain 42_110) TaxID=1358809 RepID=S7W915_SPRLO|nr:hypothetical protein SLOPH_807 [Spraguea lophii 42_110]